MVKDICSNISINIIPKNTSLYFANGDILGWDADADDAGGAGGADDADDAGALPPSLILIITIY